MTARGELIDGGRYVLVDGRRWRATDPSIPEPLRAELVGELMSARRAVKAAKPAGEGSDTMAAARHRVNDAKVALGERGEPWWDPPSPDGLRARAEATVRALSSSRADGAPITADDVAAVVTSPDFPADDAVRSAIQRAVRFL